MIRINNKAPTTPPATIAAVGCETPRVGDDPNVVPLLVSASHVINTMP